MRNVETNVFKTLFWIELLIAIYCRQIVKVYCKMFSVALGKTALGGGGHEVYMCGFFSLTIQSLQCIFKKKGKASL